MVTGLPRAVKQSRTTVHRRPRPGSAHGRPLAVPRPGGMAKYRCHREVAVKQSSEEKGASGPRASFLNPSTTRRREPALAGAGEALSLIRVSAGTDGSRHRHREVVPGHEGHRLVSQSPFSSFRSGKKVTRPL